MNDPAPSPAASRLPVWAAFLVIVAAVLAQGAVLQGDWVLDDGVAIRDNPIVREGVPGIGQIFVGGHVPGATEQGAWRPLTLVSLAIDASIWSQEDGTLEPFGFHLTNLFLHALCSVLLLFAVTRRAPGRPLLAIGAAICFAVHPMHTGTVAAVLGRADLLALALSLLALRAWDAYDGRDFVWLPVAVLLCFTALLAKEIAIGVPIALLVLDIARGGRVRGRALGYGAFLVMLLLYVFLWPGPATLGADLPDQALGTRLMLGLAGVGRLAVRLVLPVGYRADHTDEATLESGFALDGTTITVAIVVLLLAVVAAIAVRRARSPLLAGGWLATVVLGLAAAAVSPAGAAYELRFAYLVAAPLFVACGLGLEALVGAARRPSPAMATAGLVAGLGAVTCLALLSRAEAEVWRDDEALHEHVLAESPDHVGALVRQGRLLRERAERLTKRAVSLPTEDAAGRPNAELHHLNESRRDMLARARGWLERAVNSPTGASSPAAWRELGLARLAQNKSHAALQALGRAMQLDPVLQAQAREEPTDEAHFTRRQREAAASTYFAAGKARGALGERETMAEALKMAATLAPDNVRYLTDAGIALCGIRRWGEGIPLLQRARNKSRFPSERKQLEDLIQRQREASAGMATRIFRDGQKAFEDGDFRGAAVHYEAAFEADPKLLDAWIQAARLRGVWFGDYAKAHEYLNRAERIVKDAPRGVDSKTLRLIQAMRETLHEAKRKDDAEEADDGG